MNPSLWWQQLALVMGGGALGAGLRFWIGGQMIPMDFTISRMAGGKLHPFWKGRVDSIAFE